MTISNLPENWFIYHQAFGQGHDCKCSKLLNFLEDSEVVWFISQPEFCSNIRLVSVQNDRNETNRCPSFSGKHTTWTKIVIVCKFLSKHNIFISYSTCTCIYYLCKVQLATDHTMTKILNLTHSLLGFYLH